MLCTVLPRRSYGCFVDVGFTSPLFDGCQNPTNANHTAASQQANLVKNPNFTDRTDMNHWSEYKQDPRINGFHVHDVNGLVRCQVTHGRVAMQVEVYIKDHACLSFWGGEGRGRGEVFSHQFFCISLYGDHSFPGGYTWSHALFPFPLSYFCCCCCTAPPACVCAV